MACKQLIVVQDQQPNNSQLLDPFPSLCARISHSFRHVGAIQSCVQVCAERSACDDSQGVPFTLHLPRHNSRPSSTNVDSSCHLLDSLQGSQHVLIEGGAAHPSFSVALKAALTTVVDTVPYSPRLAELTCIFDHVLSTKQLQYSIKTTLDESLEADGLLKNELMMYIQSMEQEELEKFPAYTTSIRAFNQAMSRYLHKDALLLAKLNGERLHRILSSQPVLENHLVPLFRLQEVVEWLLKSITLQSRRYTDGIFVWLLWANRPLEAAELSCALRMGWALPLANFTMTATDHYAMENLKDIVTSLSGGLVTVADDQTVCFIDNSVRQYLLANCTGSENGVYPISYQAAQELLALSCLQCLMRQLKFDNAEAPAQVSHVEGYSMPVAKGFVQYARDHWSQHCRSAEASSYYVVGTLQEYLYRLKISQLQLVREGNERRHAPEQMDLRNAILHECARNGFIELGTMYLEMGAEVNDTDNLSGLGPLAMALSNQHWNMAAILIRNGASIGHSLGTACNDVLHHAAAHGREDMVTFLLDRGADPNLTTLTADIPCHWAAMLDHPAIENLADASGDAKNASRLSKATPVYFAAEFDNPNALEDLSKTADLMVGGAQHWTALHYAAAYGHTRVVEILIARGADPEARTSADMTALSLAARHGYESITRFLMDISSERTSPFNTCPSTPYRLAANGSASTGFCMAKAGIDEREKVNRFPRAHCARRQISNEDKVGIQALCKLGACDNYHEKHYKVGLLLPLCQITRARSLTLKCIHFVPEALGLKSERSSPISSPGAITPASSTDSVEFGLFSSPPEADTTIGPPF